MKRFRIISLFLVLVIAVSLFAACGKKEEDTGSKTVVWLVEGTEAADNLEVFKLFNEKLEAKTGYTVDFQYFDRTQYDLKFAAGDNFDLVISHDSLGYWKNVAKGAFMELKEEDFKEYAPYIWENGKTMLDTAKFEGKYYAIPGIEAIPPNRVIIARGDLMDQLEIDNLNTIEDIDAYLMGVAKLNKQGKTNIIPYNSPGNAPWMIFSMFASDWGWAAPGSLSYGGHYYYSIFDEKSTIFLAIDKPELKEYSVKVKEWYDNGVFSKSILSNTTSAEEAYRNGKSAFAWTSSPSTANILYNDLKAIPAAEKWDTRFYSMYSKIQKTFNFMKSAVSISRTSKNKKGALIVLNAVYEDKELYNLIRYGIEGKHYELNEHGEYTPLTENYSAPSIGVVNEEFTFATKYDFPYALDMVAEMKSIAVSDPLVNCPIHADGDAAAMQVVLGDIFTEFSTPRMYGAVPNVDEAIKKEKEALVTAKVDKYIKIVQQQVDEFNAAHPESRETFKEELKRAAEYKKKNPNKVNPKDYK